MGDYGPQRPSRRDYSWFEAAGERRSSGVAGASNGCPRTVHVALGTASYCCWRADQLDLRRRLRDSRNLLMLLPFGWPESPFAHHSYLLGKSLKHGSLKQLLACLSGHRLLLLLTSFDRLLQRACWCVSRFSGSSSSLSSLHCAAKADRAGNGQCCASCHCCSVGQCEERVRASHSGDLV